MDSSQVGRPLSPRVLKLPEVTERTGKKRSSIYRDIAAGVFPAPVKLGERASGWLEHEINAWIAERIAARERAA